jgi:hypothetical protein
MSTAHRRLDLRRRIVEAMDGLRHDPKFLSLLVAANGMRTVSMAESGNAGSRVAKSRSPAKEEYLADIRRSYCDQVSEYINSTYGLHAVVDCWSPAQAPGERYLWNKVGITFFSGDDENRQIARVAIEIGDVVFDDA